MTRDSNTSPNSSAQVYYYFQVGFAFAWHFMYLLNLFSLLFKLCPSPAIIIIIMSEFHGVVSYLARRPTVHDSVSELSSVTLMSGY